MSKKKNLVFQNLSGYSLGWNFTLVPNGCVYGTINGFDFIAEPRMCCEYRKIPVQVYQNGYVVRHPEKRVIGSIVSAIMQNSTLKLSKWDYAVDWEKAVKADTIAREHTEQVRECKMIRSAHANRTSAGHRPSKHTKAFRSNDNFFTAEYNDASIRIYGKSVDINGRVHKCTGKTAEFLDGAGCCAKSFDNADRRPLEPVFPLKSGKKAR